MKVAAVRAESLGIGMEGWLARFGADEVPAADNGGPGGAHGRSIVRGRAAAPRKAAEREAVLHSSSQLYERLAD